MICDHCKHFSAGIPESRSHPGDSPDCSHPKLFALMSNNMKRGAIRNCKGFESKRQITYRQVQHLKASHPLMRAFMAQEEHQDQCLAAAGNMPPQHDVEGSLAEFDRYIAGDR
jgi:hypothetical protein